MLSSTSHSEPAKPNRLLSLLLVLGDARSATFSLLIHVIILLALGTVVLHTAGEVTEDFVGGDGNILVPSDGLPPPPEAQPEQSVPTESIAPPQAVAPTMNVIASATTSSTFQVKSTMNLSGVGSLHDSDAVSKAMGAGKQLLGLGSGVGGASIGGGKGRFFGSKQQTSNALMGRFYDLKQTRARKPSGVSPDEYHKIFRKFVRDDWNPSILNDYFRSSKPLYATQIMIPNMPADEGPKAFDLEKDVQPSRWLVHYTGRVSPSESGTYHFVGAGDDVMIVRFNGKVVLDRCWYQDDQEWTPKKNYQYGWTNIPNGFAVGDPIEVKAGDWYDMEVLIGEQPGGLVFACLLMEKDGEDYPRDPKGNPILPVFRLADLPMPELQPGQTLPPFMPVGPVWKAGSAR